MAKRQKIDLQDREMRLALHKRTVHNLPGLKIESNNAISILKEQKQHVAKTNTALIFCCLLITDGLLMICHFSHSLYRPKEAIINQQTYFTLSLVGGGAASWARAKHKVATFQTS